MIVWWYSHICNSNFWGGSVLDNDDDRTEQTRQKHQQQEVIDNKDVASLRAQKVFDPFIPPPGDTNKVIVTANISVEDLKEKLDSLMGRVNDGVNSKKCTLCGKVNKEPTKQNMRTHIETWNIEGFPFHVVSVILLAGQMIVFISIFQDITEIKERRDVSKSSSLHGCL